MPNPIKPFTYIKIPDSLVRGTRAGRYPFYSTVDEAIAEITKKQPKGTGDQYLAMLEKTKGVKKAEIKDRGLDQALKGAGKLTGKDVEKIARENPPVDISNKVLREAEDEAVYVGDEYGKYRTPGTENYREILLKLPPRKLTQAPETLTAQQIKDAGYKAQLTNYNRYTGQADYVVRDRYGNVFTQRSGQRFNEEPTEDQMLESVATGLNVRNNAEAIKNITYNAPHFGEHRKDLLAHARVADMRGPNGEKIMVIDEIQSDWHQAGRKRGYGPKMETSVEAYYTTPDGQKVAIGFGKTKEEAEASIDPGWKNVVDIKYDTKTEEVGYGVADAPFKKNWHELVTKRLMDEAVRGGYDRVLIAPGAEQARRYDLSSHLDSLEVKRNLGENTVNLTGWKGGQEEINRNIPINDLPDVVGKDMAEKISQRLQTAHEATFEGLDLEVGGEGMKGFYDQIIPAYIRNQYGLEQKAHALPLREYDVVRNNRGEGYDIVNKGAFTTIKGGFPTIEEAQAAARSLGTPEYHAFDITPELRESITKKGQPLYQAAPVGIGVGVATEQYDNPPEAGQMKRGGRVKVNMDAMKFAVADKKLKGKKHG